MTTPRPPMIPAPAAPRPIHHATLRADVRTLLGQVPLVTTAQLERLGLLGAAQSMGLAQITLHCRTRVTQQGSVEPLTFVSLDGALLGRPAQALMHLAGAVEARRHCRDLRDGERFEIVTAAGRPRGNLPDAEIISGGPNACRDIAVEFDAGYPPSRVEQKLRAFAHDGYAGILWATSVHGRVDRIYQRMCALEAAGGLSGVGQYRVAYVNFWTAHGDPYQVSSRNSKPVICSSR